MTMLLRLKCVEWLVGKLQNTRKHESLAFQLSFQFIHKFNSIQVHSVSKIFSSVQLYLQKMPNKLKLSKSMDRANKYLTQLDKLFPVHIFVHTILDFSKAFSNRQQIKLLQLSLELFVLITSDRTLSAMLNLDLGNNCTKTCRTIQNIVCTLNDKPLNHSEKVIGVKEVIFRKFICCYFGTYFETNWYQCSLI